MTMNSLAKLLLLCLPVLSVEAAPPLVFSCSPENDLYRTLRTGTRYATPAEAVAKAPRGAGVLLLADQYPAKTVVVDDKLWEQARRKQLRVYIEYPAALPGLDVGPPQTTEWGRTVVTSEAFGPELAPMRILAIQDSHFVSVPPTKSDLAMARVAGFDTAVYGLPRTDVFPILFEHTRGDILVSTTKLSQFITARYAPTNAWGPVLERVLAWLRPGTKAPPLDWTPAVRPTYRKSESLRASAEVDAFQRGVTWYEAARMLVGPSWKQRIGAAESYKDKVAPPPETTLPPGDGSEGVLEGFSSAIKWDGSQWVRWWLRADCNSETSLPFALSSVIDGRRERATMAANLQDVVYFKSPLVQGSRNDPKSPSFGLIGWNTAANYYKNLDGFGVYYGDDNARAMLGTMGAAALLKSDRWDEPLMRALLANFRTTGKLGFRPNRIDEAPLQKNGWQHYYASDVISYAPHYQAYLWACLLWGYNHTGYEPFLARTKNAIRMTMAAYPDNWHWTNGIQQERARMLLPLAWLVQLEDTAEHRGWLRKIADDLLASQDASGAIREEIGSAGKGDYGPPKSNEAYGTNEATLIQTNGDPLADLLYTTNFAFLGLHEAAGATGDPLYRNAEQKLAEFLVRIQARSEARPEFDGAWFRAFEFRRWEYWASNADAGWGAWSVETGWTQSWITSVLAMRHLKTTLWDLTRESGIRKQFDRTLAVMIPDAKRPSQ